jgi:hypothetical protein
MYNGDYNENNPVLSHNKYRLVSTCCSLLLFTHGLEHAVLLYLGLLLQQLLLPLLLATSFLLVLLPLVLKASLQFITIITFNVSGFSGFITRLTGLNSN